MKILSSFVILEDLLLFDYLSSRIKLISEKYNLIDNIVSVVIFTELFFRVINAIVLPSSCHKYAF